MEDLTNLSDEQLISKHTFAWRAWVKARQDFGELGTPNRGEGVSACELEARKRGIPDARLMEAVDADMKRWPPLDFNKLFQGLWDLDGESPYPLKAVIWLHPYSLTEAKRDPRLFNMLNQPDTLFGFPYLVDRRLPKDEVEIRYTDTHGMEKAARVKLGVENKLHNPTTSAV